MAGIGLTIPPAARISSGTTMEHMSLEPRTHDAIAESRDLVDHLFWRLTQFTLGVGAVGALATIHVFRKGK